MKRKLSAKDLLSSIHSGLTYQELLDRYALTELQLDKALARLVRERLVAPRALPRKTVLDTRANDTIRGRPKGPEQPNLRDMVASIRVGYSRHDLCRQYGLRPNELNQVLDRIVERGLLSRDEIPSRKPTPRSAGTRVALPPIATDTPATRSHRLITLALCLIIVGASGPVSNWIGMPQLPPVFATILRYIMYLGFFLLALHVLFTPGSWKARGPQGADYTWLVTTTVLMCLLVVGYWVIVANNPKAARAVRSVSDIRTGDQDYCRVLSGCFGVRNRGDVEMIETLIYAGRRDQVEEMLHRGLVTWINKGKVVEVVDYSIPGTCRIRIPNRRGLWWVHPDKLSPYSL